MWRRALLLLALSGCADESGRALLDLEGPEGRAAAPGPWPVDVLATADAVELFVSVDDGPFAASPLARWAPERFRGHVPAQPVGRRVRYYVRAGAETLPAGAPERARAFVVTAPDAALADAAPPAGCTLRFRHPLDGARLGPADDAAPQAGLQVTVVVETDLPDGTPATLDVDGAGHAGVAGGGVVAFADVTLAAGAHVLRVEGRRPGGPPCAAAIRVAVGERAGSAP